MSGRMTVKAAKLAEIGEKRCVAQLNTEEVHESISTHTCSPLSEEETCIRIICLLKGKSHSTVFSFDPDPSGKSP